MYIMSHKTTLELPDEIWEDIQKRKFRNEGGVRDLMVRAYRVHYQVEAKKEESQPEKS